MRSVPKIRLFLIISLILLFAGLSFNAYACLMPLFGTTTASMGNGCATPEEPPVREFCDAFKLLTVHNSSGLYHDVVYQAFYPEESASFSQLLNLRATNHLTFDHPEHAPPRDVLLKTTVLRI
jgi:hypothetical protein